MKKYLYIALASFTNIAIAQNKTSKSTLQGAVIDAQTKKYLNGATITIHDAKVVVRSNKDGFFKTPELNSGNYLVEISYVGYASVIENININGNINKVFEMQERVREQEAVTVTGSSSATTVKSSPQPIVVINKQELQANASVNLMESLAKTVSGFSVLTTGVSIAKPIIRGLGYNRMTTIHDGVKQEGQQWGDEHGIEIDGASVQKVEVLKGASSLMYGSDAMAGVLNIITNQPIQLNTIKANVEAGYIDNNKALNTYANVAGHLKNGFNFNIYGSLKNTHDYSNAYDGKVLNSRFNEQNFGGYIGVNKHWGYSHFLFSSFNQKLGLIEGTRDSATGLFTLYSGTPKEHIATHDELNSSEVFIPHQTINHTKFTSDNSINLKKGRLTFNFSHQQNIRKEFGDVEHPTSPELYFDLQTTSYNVQYHAHTRNNFKTSFGIAGANQINKNKGAEYIIPEFKQNDFGIFVVTKKSINKLTISGGARFDVRKINTDELLDAGNIKFSTLNKSFSNYAASIGLSYSFNDSNTIKFNIAKGFRAPTVTELCSNGAHEGTNRYEYGNKELLSENSYQFDLGFESTTKHVSFSINTFYNRINNYIFYNKLANYLGEDSLVNVDGEDLQAFKFNQSGAVLYGFETSLDIHPHPLDWLHIENSFSIVRGEFVSNINGAKNLPFMPQPRLLSEIKADIKSIGKSIKNGYIKFQLDNYLEQNNIYAINNTETQTPAYSLMNFGLGFGVFNKQNKNVCSMHLAINNIADVAYQNHLSRLKYTDVNYVTNRTGVFNMGRNISFKILVPLSFDLK